MLCCVVAATRAPCMAALSAASLRRAAPRCWPRPVHRRGNRRTFGSIHVASPSLAGSRTRVPCCDAGWDACCDACCDACRVACRDDCCAACRVACCDDCCAACRVGWCNACCAARCVGGCVAGRGAASRNCPLRSPRIAGATSFRHRERDFGRSRTNLRTVAAVIKKGLRLSASPP